jgi:rare lipoprotein A
VPDAEPKVEPIRQGGPNKPYEVLGKSYTPMTTDQAWVEKGLASWYGRKFHGRRTANGEVYDMYAMTAAHPTMPLPSYARVKNPLNGREVVVRINDRGPFHPGRVIDLSYTAAHKLDLLRGVGPVEVQRITFEEIRTGAWRSGAPAVAQAAPPVPSQPPPRAPGTPAQPPATAVLSPVPSTATASSPVSAATPIQQAGQDAAYWLQLGAFRQKEGAQAFHQKVIADLAWIAPLLGVMDEPPYFRLLAGPYASRTAANQAAQQVREALRLVPQIVQRGGAPSP